MIELLLLIGAGAVVFWWWHRRQAHPSLPPVDEEYVCPACNETDCTCEKKSDEETRIRP
jgi:hypothetical protein